MLKISRLADYSIVLLLHAAEDGAGIHTARGLAKATSLPLPTVTKILKALARHGILGSQRGKTGGYRLTRPVEQISVVDVITAIDGKPAMTQCTEEAQAPCERASFCRTKGHWRQVHETVLTALETLTLADMAQPATNWAPAGALVSLANRGRRNKL